MCGACGTKVDWAGPMVAGPLRRRDIGRCMTALCPTVTVDVIPRGWMVKGRTGISRPAQTLDELCDALVPHVRLTGWDEMEQALLEVPAPVRVDTSKDDWTVPAGDPGVAEPVLGAVTHLPVHMKVAAFALGARVFSSPAALCVDTEPTHFLVARNGHLPRK